MAKMYDITIIGGGPAGMGAGIECAKTGAKTLIIERENRLGGILNQCIHNGFGLHYFKEELTGPEYAHRFEELLKDTNVDVSLNTFVTKIDNKDIYVVSPEGAEVISPKAIVLAMGCREKTAGNIRLKGTRPAGIMTAGQVQKLVNFHGKLPGKKVVILGSGLKRNIVQCLDDFDIPIHYSTTITEVVGKDRVEGIKYAQVDDKMKEIPETEKFMECDLVVLSVGLTPENDIVSGYPINPMTNGFVVNEFRECADGVFACGNVLQVHDLVDNVTCESMLAGKNAGLFAMGKLQKSKSNSVIAGDGIRYTVPGFYFENNDELEVFFRVNNKQKNAEIVVSQNGEVVKTKFAVALNPGEMSSIKFDKLGLNSDITISVREKK